MVLRKLAAWIQLWYWTASNQDQLRKRIPTPVHSSQITSMTCVVWFLHVLVTSAKVNWCQACSSSYWPSMACAKLERFNVTQPQKVKIIVRMSFVLFAYMQSALRIFFLAPACFFSVCKEDRGRKRDEEPWWTRSGTCTSLCWLLGILQTLRNTGSPKGEHIVNHFVSLCIGYNEASDPNPGVVSYMTNKHRAKDERCLRIERRAYSNLLYSELGLYT